MGFLAGCARWCTDSVWAAAGTHGGLHLGLISASVLAIPVGPTSWVVLGIMQALIGVALLLIHRPQA